MAEDIKLALEQEVAEVVAEVVPEYSETEIQALDQGWKPKEEWEGNPDEWRPAKEFVERGELFKKIDSQKHQLADMKKAVTALTQHNEKIFDLSYEKALKDLKKQKQEAIEDEDIRKLAAVEEEIGSLNEDYKAEKQIRQSAVQATTPDPQYTQWLDTNAWYAQDGEMHDFADGLAAAFIARTGDKNLANVLKEVDSKIRKAFPEKFGNTRQREPSKVEGAAPTRGKQTQGKLRVSDLSEQEQRIMKTIVNSGALTEDQYLSDYAKARG